MNTDFSKDHFALFGLPASFDVDLAALDHAYRDLQREVHPDRHAQASDAEQRVAAQWSTRLNEAYRTLKSPINRGRYILQLNGVDTGEETDTAMPLEFLTAQMEWRESVENARRSRDEAGLNSLAIEERAVRSGLTQALRNQLASMDWPAARLSVRKLRFIDKLAEEIDLAAESMES